MIPKQTVEAIIDAARIDEVVGEFVRLRRRGANLLGLCPFHTEKTPSFTVSPAKGIFYCFGCHKGGNAVNFLMEHEHFTYVEALKYLAQKYSIPIVEETPSAEELQAQSEREVLYNIHTFAQSFFTETLLNTEQGKAVGLSYFKERGFTDEIIKKFQLGYNLPDGDSFVKHAIKNGYHYEILEKSGLANAYNGNYYDRFKSRVIFPIHNLSGRVIAFGGRVLHADKTVAKYVNSPETDIYHKSNVLYGIYFAKSAIISQNNCLLVEGYTDVISLHQAEIFNVVASSGTALTTEQIKLIKRFTSNVTILYDGDAAGIKASLRGIDMILEEGLNVKVVLFPDGEDPDSFSQSRKPIEIKDYINQHAVDFIKFKTQLLLQGVENDPVKKAELIKDIIQSISAIPDPIIRMVYVKECSILFEMGEQTLMNELNRKLKKKVLDAKNPEIKEKIATDYDNLPNEQIIEDIFTTESQEKELINYLIKYGNEDLKVTVYDEFEKPSDILVKAALLILSELQNNEITFDNANYQLIYEEYLQLINQETYPDEKYFHHHSNSTIANTVISMMTFPYELSKNWELKKQIYTADEKDDLKGTITKSLDVLKAKKLEAKIRENEKRLKAAQTDEEFENLLKQRIKMLDIRKKLASATGGRVIIK